MLFRDGYVIDAPVQCRPAYRISPFSNEDIHLNRALVCSDIDDEYFSLRFGHSNYCYTSTGRDALSKVFSLLGLNRSDTVTILTTTGNKYISGCVTSEIDKYCSWNRVIDSATSAILVNHEFGYPYEGIEALRQYSVPIIEDCAHSFASSGNAGLVGSHGDFSIFSLSKYFPMQIGGLLVSNCQANVAGTLDPYELAYIKSVVSAYVPKINDINRARLNNHDYLLSKLRGFGVVQRIMMYEGCVPGVFLFSFDQQVDLVGLKSFMQENGVESSVFYGENAFFVPVNQGLTQFDLDYFAVLLSSKLSK